MGEYAVLALVSAALLIPLLYAYRRWIYPDTPHGKGSIDHQHFYFPVEALAGRDTEDVKREGWRVTFIKVYDINELRIYRPDGSYSYWQHYETDGIHTEADVWRALRDGIERRG